MSLVGNFYIGIVIGIVIVIFMIYSKMKEDPDFKDNPRGKIEKTIQKDDDDYDDSELRAIQKEEKESG